MRIHLVAGVVLLAAGCRVSVCPGSGGSPAYFCTPAGRVDPAGMNYTQVKRLSFTYPSGFHKNDIVHSTLYTGLYDPARVDAALDRMAADGYLFIRVFIAYDGEGTELDAQGNVVGGPFYGIAGPWTIGPDHVNGLYRPYMDNFVDLLRRAWSRGMHVQPTFEWLPENAYYDVPGAAQPRAPDGTPYVEGVNLFYLAQPWIDKKNVYVRSFLSYVRDTDPSLLPAIIAIDLQNEVFVDTALAPFTRTDVVPLPDGLSYDMSKDVDRQQAVDANLVQWANQQVAAARGVDPDVLVGASVFTFNAIGLGGPNGVHSNGALRETRYPARPWSLATYSNLSYTDMHVYLAPPPTGGPYSLNNDVESSELSHVPRQAKPLIVGEFGTFRGLYANAAAAAPALKQHKDALKALGFAGWSFWTWDISKGTTFSTFDATEQGGVIDAALNPAANGF
jgi:hypothetical protein